VGLIVLGRGSLASLFFVLVFALHGIGKGGSYCTGWWAPASSGPSNCSDTCLEALYQMLTWGGMYWVLEVNGICAQLFLLLLYLSLSLLSLGWTDFSFLFPSFLNCNNCFNDTVV
jgi:hypothetical protein